MSVESRGRSFGVKELNAYDVVISLVAAEISLWAGSDSAVIKSAWLIEDEADGQYWKVSSRIQT